MGSNRQISVMRKFTSPVSDYFIQVLHAEVNGISGR